jgi:putative transposase
MDGLGRWMDDVFIGCLRRLLRYEYKYLHGFKTDPELRAASDAMNRTLQGRPTTSGLAGLNPDKAYGPDAMQLLAGLAPPAAKLRLVL